MSSLSFLMAGQRLGYSGDRIWNARTRDQRAGSTHSHRMHKETPHDTGGQIRLISG